MPLTKFYYRDEPYYYDTRLDPTFNCINNFLYIYKKRTSWLRHIFKYKCVFKQEFDKDELTRPITFKEKTLPTAMRNYLPDNTHRGVIMIDCSKEIEDLVRYL